MKLAKEATECRSFPSMRFKRKISLKQLTLLTSAMNRVTSSMRSLAILTL